LAPSRNGTTSATTATIGGLIAAGPVARVVVVGTALSAPVGADRRFTLPGVPVGAPQLHFSGGSAAATLTVNDVKPGEIIQLVVAVSGSVAAIQEDSRNSSAAPGVTGLEVELTGAITAVAGACPAVTLTIGGQQLVTSAATRYSSVACADLRSGLPVSAEGWRQPDGSVAVTEVEGRRASAPGGVRVEVSGPVEDLAGGCPNLSFTVGGQRVSTSSATRFDETFCADLRQGSFVEVEGSQQADGGVLATEVEVDAPDANDGVEQIEVRGAIGAVQGACPNLTLTIGSITVFTNGSTEFERLACADVRNGAAIEIDGARGPDGRVVATEVEPEFGTGGVVEIEADGFLADLGGACPGLTFTVAGQRFVTDAVTKFRGLSCGALAGGVRVEAVGQLLSDGSVRATRVERD
jgi:hypothetical protein